MDFYLFIELNEEVKKRGAIAGTAACKSFDRQISAGYRHA